MIAGNDADNGLESPEHREGSERREPLIFVLSGPGGVGKGTVVERLLETVDGLWLSRSWTTRERRPGESADAYVFVTRDEFEGHIERGGFLEWVEFLEYLQGTPVPEPPPDHDVVLEIDIQGAQQVKKLHPDAVLLFLDAPSVEEQERRLRARGDTEERVAKRLAHAVAERIAAAELGCTMLINDDIDSSVAELADLISQFRTNT